MDINLEWPEPVVPVQSLSESGVAVVPNRYVKPPEQRPSSQTIHSEGINIPVIDLRGLSGDVSECRDTMMAISNACRHWGFFQLVNHGVSSNLIESARKAWKDFFHLPMSEKLNHSNNPRTYEGYGSRLGVQKNAILDWGDYYFLNIFPRSARNQCKWLALPNACREILDEYGKEMARLSGTLMKVLSLSLGLDVGSFQKALGGDSFGGSLRVNYYPKCPQPDLTLGLSSHSDPGALTILVADDHVDGLQVRKADGWVTVKTVPSGVIVNVGDQIQVLSNAIYKSVEHRVVTNSLSERLSLVFFYNPKSDIPIGPMPDLVTPDNPSLYRPMTFNEYRMFIRKRGPQGKSQVESLKAM